MATSGTNAFDLSIDELIEEAYERCGLELRTGYDLDSAKRSLNIMDYIIVGFFFLQSNYFYIRNKVYTNYYKILS